MLEISGLALGNEFTGLGSGKLGSISLVRFVGGLSDLSSDCEVSKAVQKSSSLDVNPAFGESLRGLTTLSFERLLERNQIS